MTTEPKACDNCGTHHLPGECPCESRSSNPMGDLWSRAMAWRSGDGLSEDLLAECALWAHGEIERLTAEWTNLEAQYSDLWRRHCDQRDDYDRLRAALERIQKWDCLNPPRADLLGDLPWLRKLVDEAIAGAPDETTAAHEMRCPVHWTYENGLRIRCKKAMGHPGECDLK